MLRDGRRKPLSRLTIRHGQPARTLTLPSRRWIVPHLGGTIRRSAPGLTPPGPGSRQPFIDENIADIAAFDALGWNVSFDVLANSGYKITSADIYRRFAASVPEPATWAMLIAGFGMVGAAVRRRRTTIAFA